MFERSISMEDVRHVIDNGEVIASYDDDVAYPSRLLLGWSNVRPIHVLLADNVAEREVIVVTVYEPDPTLWNEAFRRRRW